MTEKVKLVSSKSGFSNAKLLNGIWWESYSVSFVIEFLAVLPLNRPPKGEVGKTIPFLN